jgi:ADP-heptose:LPS heptosyltransferase
MSDINRRYTFQKKRWKALVRAVDYLGDLFFLERNKVESRRIQKILLVRLDHFGDGVLLSSLIRELRRSFPNAKIAGLFSEEVSAVVNSSLLDGQWLLQKHWLSRENPRLWSEEIRHVFSEIKKQKFDLGLDPRGDLRSILFLKKAGIPYRIGYGSSGGGFWLTTELEEEYGIHEVDRNLNLLKPLGKIVESRLPEVLSGELPNDFPSSKDRVVAVHVGAGNQAKTWPIKYWSEVVNHFISKGMAIALLGKGLKDREFASEFEGRPEVWVGVDRLSFKDSFACIQNSSVFIGVDSGLAHGAGALGVSSCIIESGTNEPDRWSVLGSSVKHLRHPVYCSPCHRTVCPFPTHDCMNSQIPESVIEAVESLLGTPA